MITGADWTLSHFSFSSCASILSWNDDARVAPAVDDDDDPGNARDEDPRGGV